MMTIAIAICSISTNEYCISRGFIGAEGIGGSFRETFYVVLLLYRAREK
jgi:hypothetical protein